MSQSEKVLSHPTNSTVYLSLLVNGSCMDFSFLFSHRKCKNSADLEMYYLPAGTKCCLTPAVPGPYSESLRSLTKPLAQGITDGSPSHGKHSTSHREPTFTALSGTENTSQAGNIFWKLEGICQRDRDYLRDSALPVEGCHGLGSWQAERAGAGTEG